MTPTREIAITRSWQASCCRDNRPHRPGPATSSAQPDRSRTAEGPSVPRSIHRCHGAAGSSYIVVRAAEIVIHKFGRDDIAFTLIGSGDCFADLLALRDELGLADNVLFTGRVPDELVTRILSTADVGLSPDPKNPLNDLSTMNKSMEYMAFELPVLAFDLHETRISVGDAGVYVRANDVHDYAQAIIALMDDEPRRARLGKLGRTRVEQELASCYRRAPIWTYIRN